MKTQHGLLILIASLMIISTFFLPLWSISLQAPQYPEGLGLNIYINNIKGHKPNDLNSINNLNHYIGMKKINPDTINELKIIPYLISFFVIFGLFIYFFRKRFLVYLWIGLFAVTGLVGLYDFYNWEFDYGHNLDPHAIIKIPGMSYQPPLIGTEKLLNFTATSLPSWGFLIIGFSIILMIVYLIIDRRHEKA